MRGNSGKSQSSCYKYFHFLPFVPFSPYVSIVIIDLMLSCESVRLSLIQSQHFQLHLMETERIGGHSSCRCTCISLGYESFHKWKDHSFLIFVGTFVMFCLLINFTAGPFSLC